MPRQGTLNDRQRRFCELLAGGLSQAKAYADAGYTCTGAHKLAARLAGKPEVQAYLEELREDAKTATTLALQEKREFLARVIRTPIGSIDENSPLAQEKTVRHDEKGSTVERVKMPSKLEALRLDSQLAGHIDSRSNVTVHNTVVPQFIERSTEEQEAFAERVERIRQRMGISFERN